MTRNSARSISRSVPEVSSALVAAAAAAYVARGAWTRGFPLDDAWIHMVYGLGVVRDHALAYNDGVPATGATSPLWAVCAGLAHLAVGARAPSMGAALALKIFGAAFHATASAIAARCARVASARASLGGIAALTAGLLVAVCPLLAYAAVSGMEVSLTSALLLAALLAAARGRSAWTGAAMGLALLARPECAVVAPVVVGLLLVRAPTVRIGSKRAAIASILIGALGAAFVARTLAVSGRPLPATFYAKAAPVSGRIMMEVRMDRGFGDVLGALAPTSSRPFWMLVAFAVVVSAGACVVAIAARARSRFFFTTTFGGAFAVAGLAYAAAVAWILRVTDPDLFYFQRYFAPSLPLLIVGAIAGAAAAGTLVARATSKLAARSRFRAAPAIAFALAAIAIVVEASSLPAWSARYRSDVGDIDAVQVAMGRFVASTVPPGGVVWSMDAGAIRYWGDHTIVDLGRLNTPDLFQGGAVLPRFAADTIVLIDGAVHLRATSGALERVHGLLAPSLASRAVGQEFSQVAWRCRAGLEESERAIVIEGYPEPRTGFCARR